MANKVFTINSQSTTQSTLNGDTYRDINMMSDAATYPYPAGIAPTPITINQHVIETYALGSEDSVSALGEDNGLELMLYSSDTQTNYLSVATTAGIQNRMLAVINEAGVDENALLKLYKAKAPYKVAKLSDINAIKNSLHNIFTWSYGERILNPEFGTKLKQYLYEGITDFNTEAIMAEIRSAISQWEPRVRIEKVVNVNTIDDVENNNVHLEVIYSIPGLSDQLLSEPILYHKGV